MPIICQSFHRRVCAAVYVVPCRGVERVSVVVVVVTPPCCEEWTSRSKGKVVVVVVVEESKLERGGSNDDPVHVATGKLERASAKL